MKMIQDLRKTMEKMQEMFAKHLEELRANKHEYIRRNQQQNKWGRRTDKWPGRENGETTVSEQDIEKRKKKDENSLRDLWDNIKCTNIHIRGLRRRRERERTWEYIWRDNSWNFPNMGKEIIKSRKHRKSQAG